MKASGRGSQVAERATLAIKAIDAQLEEDAEALKDLHAKRQASETDKAKWERAKVGLDRAQEIKKRLSHLWAQAINLGGCEVELNEAECALFAFGEID